MHPYPPTLKHNARALCAAMTDAEQLLWFRLRRKQLRGIQFYRQKPVAHTSWTSTPPMESW